jgi:hypothetical protein
MPSPAPSTKTTLTEYQESIEKLASKDGRFEPLNIFLSIKPRAESKIHAVHYSNASPEIKPLREDELETYLKDDPASTLFIVEDISRDTLALLGHHCKPDPQFFLDYLDVVKPTASTPKCSKVGSDHLTPLSWFRLGDIENHLPSLQSIQDNSNHITVRFVGPREYIPNKNATKKLKNINERIDSPDKPGNVLRLAGGHIPIHFKGQQLWEAAMNRTSTAAWFDSGTNWRKGRNASLVLRLYLTHR